MDLQKFIDSYEPMSCIMSVRTFPDGSYGDIRIVCGNKAYVDSIENPDNIAYSGMLKNEFLPGSPYEVYIPKDLNFEDVCYRSAVQKKPFHSYIHPERYDFWVDMYLMPLAVDEGDTHYCVYTQELTPYASTSRMSNMEAGLCETILQTCIKLHDSNDYKHTMDEIMKDLCKQCEADKVCLILTDMQKRTFSILSEAAGSPAADYSVEGYLRATYEDFFDIIETWDQAIAGSTCLIIQNENDMEVLRQRNPVWHRSLQDAYVRTIVLYPLKYNHETLGYIWALNFNSENTQRIRSLLELTTFFVASEIANHKLIDKMKLMSWFDMLTGVSNRNAMNQRVDNIIKGNEKLPDETAVIFIDLNGLKQVNDNGGHADGDVLLQKAANILKDVFPDGDIYRAGGDEFMVLIKDITEKVLEERLEKLNVYRTDSADVSFAVGYYCSDGSVDIRNAMTIADKRMYDDKQRYYEDHPYRSRR